MVSKDDMKKWALAMAKANKKEEPSISRIFWFPHGEELRLVEVDEICMASDVVEAFHFGPNPAGGVPVPSALALIRPEEVPQQLKLPDDWGTWDDAEEITDAAE